MQEAIYAETPTIVFPSAADQQWNARALIVNGAAVDLWDMTFASISQSVAEILEQSNYSKMKSRLREMNQTMTSLGGYSKTAEIVEKVAKGEIKVKQYPEDKTLNLLSVIYIELAKGLVVFVVVLVLLVFTCGKGFKKLMGKKKTVKTE